MTLDRPYLQDIALVRGDTLTRVFQFSQSLTGPPVNITGWSFLLQVRQHPYGPVLQEYSTANGHIVITSATGGTITLTDSASDTAAYNWSQGVYDLQATRSDGSVQTLLAGNFIIDSDVSRPTP